MGYHYKPSGYSGCDFLVVTKKGMTEGGLPKGIVFLTGMMYSDKEFCKWMKEDSKEGLHVYVAKHCDDENVLTHISKKGFVNRFGYFVTKKDMFAIDDSDYDVAKGCWFTRKHVENFQDALIFLN